MEEPFPTTPYPGSQRAKWGVDGLRHLSGYDLPATDQPDSVRVADDPGLGRFIKAAPLRRVYSGASIFQAGDPTDRMLETDVNWRSHWAKQWTVGTWKPCEHAKSNR
jgi:hypothetical protein